MNFYLIRDTSKTWIGTLQKNKNLNKEIDLGNLNKLVYRKKYYLKIKYWNLSDAISRM